MTINEVYNQVRMLVPEPRLLGHMIIASSSKAVVRAYRCYTLGATEISFDDAWLVKRVEHGVTTSSILLKAPQVAEKVAEIIRVDNIHQHNQETL